MTTGKGADANEAFRNLEKEAAGLGLRPVDDPNGEAPMGPLRPGVKSVQRIQDEKRLKIKLVREATGDFFEKLYMIDGDASMGEGEIAIYNAMQELVQLRLEKQLAKGDA